MPSDNSLSAGGPADALFYKRLLDRLNDGVYFVDRDRRITYWNQGAARLTVLLPKKPWGGAAMMIFFAL